MCQFSAPPGLLGFLAPGRLGATAKTALRGSNVTVFSSDRPPGLSGSGRLARSDGENDPQRLKYVSFRLRQASWASLLREAPN